MNEVTACRRQPQGCGCSIQHEEPHARCTANNSIMAHNRAFPTASCSSCRGDTDVLPQNSSWVRRGGGPSPSAQRDADQVSQGGPPPDKTTRPARMWFFHVSSVERFIMSPRVACMAMSIDRTTTAKFDVYYDHSTCACTSPARRRPQYRLSTKYSTRLRARGTGLLATPVYRSVRNSLDGYLSVE